MPTGPVVGRPDRLFQMAAPTSVPGRSGEAFVYQERTYGNPAAVSEAAVAGEPTFIGVDLAWSPRNRSGGAVLSAQGDVRKISGALGDDSSILSFITEAIPASGPGVVAIDAPLAVPNESGGRPCDRQVASLFGRFQAGPYPANRSSLARYGGLRAEAIRQRLGSLGYSHSPEIVRKASVRQVIEVFPHPAIVSLFGLEHSLKYKARRGRGYEQRWNELSRLRDLLVSLGGAEPPLNIGPGLAEIAISGRRGRAFKEIEDQLDAVVCAYCALHAWYYGPRGYAVYGRELTGHGQIGYPGKGEGHILVPMSKDMWKKIKSRRLLFLDRDGTLNRSLGLRPPNDRHEVELLPGVGATLHNYASQGWSLVIVTNQGGVAFGYLTEQQARSVHASVLEALPVEIDASYICPHHPEGTISRYATDCPNRKPATGAIRNALDTFGADARQCLFVGDQETDRQAASVCGIEFRWASEFFGWS